MKSSFHGDSKNEIGQWECHELVGRTPQSCCHGIEAT